jgi:predicted transcriptional regulator of viral defense system
MFGVSAPTARRLRVIGAAIVLLVLVTAPFERWYLVRRANAMQERIFDLRSAASARFPEGWQRDLVAVDEVAELEYRRAQVRRRIVTQLTTEGWTLRLLLVGMVLVIVGLIGEKGEGRRTRR